MGTLTVLPCSAKKSLVEKCIFTRILTSFAFTPWLSWHTLHSKGYPNLTVISFFDKTCVAVLSDSYLMYYCVTQTQKPQTDTDTNIRNYLCIYMNVCSTSSILQSTDTEPIVGVSAGWLVHWSFHLHRTTRKNVHKHPCLHKIWNQMRHDSVWRQR